jgi:hypothetical protein
MKFIAFISMFIFSLSASAAWNELECTGRFEGKHIRLEIEESFPNGSYFKRAELTVLQDGSEQTYHYTVSRRSMGMNRIDYSSAGLRIEVDLWPDQTPRWGRSYRGSLLSSVLGNKYIRGFNCQFPNAW